MVVSAAISLPSSLFTTSQNRNYSLSIFANRSMELKVDLPFTAKATQLLESVRTMDLGEEIQKIFGWITMTLTILLYMIGHIGLLLLWGVVHLFVSVFYFFQGISDIIESCLISFGIVNKYNALDIGLVRYLAVVVDSEEARQTSGIIELLHWLSDIGVKKVCLYDAEGVLKTSKAVITERFNHQSLCDDASKNAPLLNQNQIDIEFVSISDGKEAIAKSANLLFSKYYLEDQKSAITETHLTEALMSIGCGRPDPDLLLVYGPVRCHLGFPAWRIRYTEIVHMGPLKWKKYGLLIKAIYRFTLVKQNFGS